MSTIVMIYGQSGTGKSTSLRNMPRDKTAVINVLGKPLPFRQKKDEKLLVRNSDEYDEILQSISKAAHGGFNRIVIDDATYLMTNEFMRTAYQTGFQKFTDMAVNFDRLITYCTALPDDVIVYFMGHLETDANGNEKFKTIGKLLDEKVTLEGLFTIVLKTSVSDGKYTFRTQNSGSDTVKSPMGMFETTEIDNDLNAVDAAIRNYYDMEE